MAPKTKAKKVEEPKVPAVFGIDAMVDSIAAELQGNEENPESVREITKKAIRAVIKANNDLIIGAVAAGDKVTFVGFGTYEQRARAERKGRNPQTGAELIIPAAKVPAFKPGKGFKDEVK